MTKQSVWDQPTDKLSQGLGWLSLGLGLAEIAGAQPMAKSLGMKGREPLLRAFGFREIASGLGIFLSKDSMPFVAARVLGDVMDIVVLANQRRELNPKRENVDAALATVLGATALDICCLRMQAKQRAMIG